MKTSQNFGLFYFMLTAVQIIICNCFYLSAYVTLSILPVMVLCMPASWKTVPAMLTAFVTGLAMDLLGEGLMGINALALVPVALLRKPVVQAIFGKDLIEREEDFSFRKYGAGKISLAVLIMQSIFLLIYIVADGAGTRPFWFNAARFGASLAAGYVLAMTVAKVLLPEDRK